MTEEIWKDVVGYEGYYLVSSLGRVKSLPRSWNTGSYIKTSVGKIVKLKERTGRNANRYQCAPLSINSKSVWVDVHRLVAKAFIPNPEGKPQVNHKNGIKSDNHVENLEWNTRQENGKHAFDTNLHIYKGELCNMAKLKEWQVHEILRLRKEGMLQKEIGKIFGLGQQQVSTICQRKAWKHIIGIKKEPECQMQQGIT